jgi:hypothetical protein
MNNSSVINIDNAPKIDKEYFQDEFQHSEDKSKKDRDAFALYTGFYRFYIGVW